jgi:hypothetical protein
MTRERWEDLVGMIKDKFETIGDGREPREDGPGQVEWIEFRGPLGHLRCEYSTHPKIIGKRAIGGHKVGSGAKMKYDYDPEAETATLKIYKRVGDDWEEIKPDVFGA